MISGISLRTPAASTPSLKAIATICPWSSCCCATNPTLQEVDSVAAALNLAAALSHLGKRFDAVSTSPQS